MVNTTSTAKDQQSQETRRRSGNVSPSSFFLAGRGDLKFWREDDKCTMVVREISSESDQEQWSEKIGRSKDSVIGYRSREKDEE